MTAVVMMAASVRLDGSNWGLEVLIAAGFVVGILASLLGGRR
jgi:hypothetical protein